MSRLKLLYYKRTIYFMNKRLSVYRGELWNYYHDQHVRYFKLFLNSK